MSADVVEPDLRASEDFEVRISTSVPRAVYRKLRIVAEQHGTTPGLLAAVLVSRACGVEAAVRPAPPESPKSRLSDPGVQEKLLELVAAGVSNIDIGAHFEVDARTVQRWRHLLSLPPGEGRRVEVKPKGQGGNPFRDEVNVQTFLTMYGAGDSDYAIAREIGCAAQSVARQRKMRGLLPNPQAKP